MFVANAEGAFSHHVGHGYGPGALKKKMRYHPKSWNGTKRWMAWITKKLDGHDIFIHYLHSFVFGVRTFYFVCVFLWACIIKKRWDAQPDFRYIVENKLRDKRWGVKIQVALFMMSKMFLLNGSDPRVSLCILCFVPWFDSAGRVVGSLSLKRGLLVLSDHESSRLWEWSC